jgi:hypothetical protein
VHKLTNKVIKEIIISSHLDYKTLYIPVSEEEGQDYYYLYRNAGHSTARSFSPVGRTRGGAK